MFRFIHLSDPHLSLLRRPGVTQLANKRLTGYVNWRRHRQQAHDMPFLDRVLVDMAAQNVDHIACTGDLMNLGLASEVAPALAFLQSLGTPEHVSFVPGNHDAYVRGSLERLLEVVSPWTAGDGEAHGGDFPYVRRRGSVALVGLSSAVPTLPFIATGTLGRRQLAHAEGMLEALGAANLCRVVMIHHPPYHGGAAPGRGLTDTSAFESMIERVGAELVLHGHNHTAFVAWIAGRKGASVPVLGAPSVSISGGTPSRRGGYHLVEITAQKTGFKIEGHSRGPLADGTIGDLGPLPLGSPLIRFSAGATV